MKAALGVSIGAVEKIRGTAEEVELPSPELLHLLRVKSALLSPATVTGLDCPLAPSCHAVSV
jgi:hypothetical protein